MHLTNIAVLVEHLSSIFDIQKVDLLNVQTIKTNYRLQ